MECTLHRSVASPWTKMVSHKKHNYHGAGKVISAVNAAMVQVYLLFPKRDTLCLVLSWSHYRLLMGIDNEERRNFYQKECVKGMQDQAFFTISSISLHFCSISATSRSWQRVRSRLWRSRCILKYTSPSR